MTRLSFKRSGKLIQLNIAVYDPTGDVVTSCYIPLSAARQLMCELRETIDELDIQAAFDAQPTTPPCQTC